MSHHSLKPITLVPLPAPASDAPVTPATGAPAATTVTNAAPLATDAPRPIGVLLLMHDEKLRDVLRRLRDDARYHVEEAQGHQAALIALASGPARVAVLDCTPPYLGGWTLLGRIARAVLAEPQTAQTDLAQPGTAGADFGRHAYLLVVAGDQDVTPSTEGVLRHLSAQIVAWPCSFEQVQEAVSRTAAMIMDTRPHGSGGAATT